MAKRKNNKETENTRKKKEEKSVGTHKLIGKPLQWFWVILPLAGVYGLKRLCENNPSFGPWYVEHIFPFFPDVIGRVMSLIPISVAEWEIVLLVVWILWRTAKSIRWIVKKQEKTIAVIFDWLFRMALLASWVFFLDTAACSVNYYGTSFAEKEQFSIEKSSVEELTELCRYLTEEVNAAAKELTSVKNGVMGLSCDWQKEAVKAMTLLGEQYPSMKGFYPNPKPVFFSKAMSYMEITGIYATMTIESNVNVDAPEYNIPATACHELAHMRGYAREDEANFIAYLACHGSDNAEFRYSGAMLAYVHSTNALYSADKDAYFTIRGQLCEIAEADLRANSTYWAQYETKVGEISSAANDAYLKSNGQSDGVRSYGRMVDLLLAWMREGNR